MAPVQFRQHPAEARKGVAIFILDTLLVGSLRFVLDKVAAAADAEMHDDAALRERLIEARMRLELGELSEAECSAIERDVFARLRDIRGTRGEAISMAPGDGVGGVHIESWTSGD